MAKPPLDDPLSSWADMKIAALIEMREAADRETFQARLARLRARGKAIKAALRARNYRKDTGFARLCTGRALASPRVAAVIDAALEKVEKIEIMQETN